MAKKEQKMALLWFKENYGNWQGKAYFYTDLKNLMTQLLLGGAWYCFSQESILAFREAFAKGNIKVCVVGKNYRSGKESSRFESIADGEYFVNDVVNINKNMEDFALMDSNIRNKLYWCGTHCKLGTPRDLLPHEKEIIDKTFKQATSGLNVDNVFNLFGLLCCAKDIWTDYMEGRAINFLPSGEGFENDKRQRTYLGFDTVKMFDPKEVKTKVELCEAAAREAFRLTTALTGCELYLKDYPELDFVDALMAARFLRNDDVEIKEVCKPTMTLKELFEIVVGDKESEDFGIAAKLLLDSYMGRPKENHRNIMNLLPTDGLTVLTIRFYHDNIPMLEFKGLDHCVVWCVNSDMETYNVFMWGETAATYEMIGDVYKFLEVVNNK